MYVTCWASDGAALSLFCRFNRIRGYAAAGTCVAFPQRPTRGHFIASFDSTYLLQREIMVSPMTETLSRRLVVKRWSLMFPDSDDAVPSPDSIPSAEVLSVGRGLVFAAVNAARSEKMRC
jgi:hypothetical protein